MSLALLVVLCLGQPEPPPPRLVLDGVTLANPAGTISPLGWLRIEGRPPKGPGFAFTLRFPRLAWPAAGEHDLAGGAVQAIVGAPEEPGGAPSPGRLAVAALDAQRAAFTFTWQDGDDARRLEADLPLRLHVPALAERHPPESSPPADEPDREDIVFCALGNTGTGLPGQRRIAEAIATLAPTGPLDFVLLLGNNFLPDGLANATDPSFHSRFGAVYDKERLDVPFYAVLGPADHRGNPGAQIERGKIDSRWTAPDAVFTFERNCRGKRIAWFGADSWMLAGPIPDPAVRHSLRMLVDHARVSDADWKIVFAYEPLINPGSLMQSERHRTLDDRCAVQLRNAKVDLLLCAEGGALRLSTPAGGIPLVTSGGGGGPELGTEPELVANTVFAHGGGGFTWFRFDGTKLEISFRDADGRVLYTHVLRKP